VPIISATLEVEIGGVRTEAGLGKSMRPCLKKQKKKKIAIAKRPGGMAQMVECLVSKPQYYHYHQHQKKII
jgi:hypothetical protein